MTNAIEKLITEMNNALVITRITMEGAGRTLSTVQDATENASSITQLFKLEIERAIENARELVYGYSEDESEYYTRIELSEDDIEYFIKDTFHELRQNIDENEKEYLLYQLEYYRQSSKDLQALRQQLQEIEGIITNIKTSITVLEHIIEQ